MPQYDPEWFGTGSGHVGEEALLSSRQRQAATMALRAACSGVAGTEIATTTAPPKYRAMTSDGGSSQETTTSPPTGPWPTTESQATERLMSSPRQRPMGAPPAMMCPAVVGADTCLVTTMASVRIPVSSLLHGIALESA